MRVALFGSHGFVGGAVAEALQRYGHTVNPIRAPRLRPTDASHASEPQTWTTEILCLRQQLAKSDAIINAAGNANASSTKAAPLVSANSVLPMILAIAAEERRFVHLSSAAVQGGDAILTSAIATNGFSHYSWSKIWGEDNVLSHAYDPIIYRPPGVHDASRKTTQTLARLARSRFAVIPGTGNSPTPQALLANVADAVSFLTSARNTPPIVIHPDEGLTVRSLLEALGGKPPTPIPTAMATAILLPLKRTVSLNSHIASISRRLEILWNGQPQEPSWLSENGWRLPHGIAAWTHLGQSLAAKDG